MMKNILYLIALMAIIGLWSCHSHEDEHLHEEEQHEHELEALSFTQYSDQYELFIEFSPLIKGESSEFLIHLTRLKDYSPVENLQLVFAIEGAEIQHRKIIDHPARPGIYITEYSPGKTAGNVELTISFNNDSVHDRFSLKNIEIFEDEHEFEEHAQAGEHEHGEAESQEGDISFLKEQAWKTDFAVAEVKEMPFAEIMKVSGELQALPKANNKIIANSPGILEYSRENLLPGQKISKGEPLFYVKSGGLVGQNIRTRYLQAKAEYEKNKADYERAQNLVEDQVISQREFSQVKADYERAKAEFESISSNFSNDAQVITSPIEGVIAGLSKENGAFVSEGDILAEILNTSSLILKADIPQNAIGRLSNLKTANFQTAGDNHVHNTDSLNGELLSVSQITISENYYLPVFFKIDNPGHLIPGTYAEVFLKFGQDREALLIPESAVMETEGNHYVYVQESGESYRRQDVQTGGSDGLMVSVTSGLHPGERVVSKGAYRIKLASMSGELPSHGHAH